MIVMAFGASLIIWYLGPSGNHLTAFLSKFPDVGGPHFAKLLDSGPRHLKLMIKELGPKSHKGDMVFKPQFPSSNKVSGPSE